MNYFDEEELIEFGIDMDLLAEEFARKIDGQVHGGRSDENAGVIFERKFNIREYTFIVEGYLYIRDEDFKTNFEYVPNGEFSIYFDNWEELGISPDVINTVYDGMTEELFFGGYFYNSYSDTKDHPALDLNGFDFMPTNFSDNPTANNNYFYSDASTETAKVFDLAIDTAIRDLASSFDYVMSQGETKSIKAVVPPRFDPEAEFDRLFEPRVNGSSKPKPGFTRAELQLYFDKKNIYDEAKRTRHQDGSTVMDVIDALIDEGYTDFQKKPAGRLEISDGNGNYITLQRKVYVDYYKLRMGLI